MGDFETTEKGKFVDSASSLVWPVEKPYVRWFFSNEGRLRSDVLRTSVTSNGVAATVYWRVSHVWFLVGASLIVVGLPPTVIGILSTPTSKLDVATGSILYVIGIGIGSIGFFRQAKFRRMRSEFRSEG
jgi:hypothetical protein